MIGKLNGIISHINSKYLILDVGGVGYKVHVSESLLSKSLPEQRLQVFTYLSVRENSLDLFGFETMNEQNVFEMLLDVSGIGPKSALSILNVSSIESLAGAIKRSDLSYLTKVSGIGRKTAEKIILELKDKIALTGVASHDNNIGDSDTLDALMSLGYRDSEIREALKQIPENITNVNARIKEALKYLGK